MYSENLVSLYKLYEQMENSACIKDESIKRQAHRGMNLISNMGLNGIKGKHETF